MNNNVKPGDCDAAWALCAENNKQLATFRPDPYSSEGKKPLTWKTLLVTVADSTGKDPSKITDPTLGYVCVTKYAGYTPTEANINRSRKACEAEN